MIAKLHHIERRFRGAARSGRLLARVLFVALRGLYKSLRSPNPDVAPGFSTSRHVAYRRLWVALENIYWKGRGNTASPRTLSVLLRDAEEILAQSLPYFRDADRAVIAHYILALHRFAMTSDPINNDEPAKGWECGGVPRVHAAVESATCDVVDLRNRVLRKLQHTLRDHLA